MVWKTTLSQVEAENMAYSGWYNDKSSKEIVEFQLFEERLCMPFDLFHAAIEKELERLIQTAEFSSKGWSLLQKEYLMKTKQL